MRTPPLRSPSLSSPPAPRRILVTCDAVGGLWRHALDMARALAQHDVAIVLVAFGPEPAAEQREEAREVPGLTLLWFDHPLDWLAGDETALAGVPAVLDGVAELYDVDLLHLNYPSQARGLATTRPVVAMSHSCLATWWETMREGPMPDAFALNRRLVNEGFARADRVLAPSRSHANALRRAYGPIPGLAVVHNGRYPTPTPEEARGDGTEAVVRACAVGRWWDEAKNAHVLDAAAARATTPIAAIGPTEGPQGQRVGFAHVEARGTLSARETCAALARASVFVSPARYEPFGLAVLEAAQAGCALVLADIPTFREVWDGTAFFVEPDDAAGFAQAIDRIAADPDLRAARVALARERAGAYAPTVQAARLLDVYADVLANAPDDPMRPLPSSLAETV
ncbi:glycosyltransferase family 4 protein [Salinarimonas rosea]|uniref:glycosyltransferase family 4 protein n=1 Tax=Salinarimonas rosea TaxID=552063 RepID=UPI00041FFB6E|nr:glycosyltransferase family 4 protein [Salinarimonas rosea]